LYSKKDFKFINKCDKMGDLLVLLKGFEIFRRLF